MISEAAFTHLDLDRLLENLLDGIRKVMRTDTAVALLLEETGAELVASWARGLLEEVEAGVRIPVGKGFAGRVAATRAPVFIPDVERAELVNPLLIKRGLQVAARRSAARRRPAPRRAARGLAQATRVHEGRRAHAAAARRPRCFGNRPVTALRARAGRQPPARVPLRGERAARLDARLDRRAAAPDRAGRPVPRRLVRRRHDPAGQQPPARGGRPCRSGAERRRVRVPGALPARSPVAARPGARDSHRQPGADSSGHGRAPARRPAGATRSSCRRCARSR